MKSGSNQVSQGFDKLLIGRDSLNPCFECYFSGLQSNICKSSSTCEIVNIRGLVAIDSSPEQKARCNY
ncbi:hypothetical protein PRUPE_4G204000 [Prunus persica]|uniref:Uncharacterized protein n=1 Tax=Prunus persica TaxID=3760 RepID=A0A251PNG2_PRUPE|nr:hypothetical protein PRUPE_4G204000 [Prunus persica]